VEYARESVSQKMEIGSSGGREASRAVTAEVGATESSTDVTPMVGVDTLERPSREAMAAELVKATDGMAIRQRSGPMPEVKYAVEFRKSKDLGLRDGLIIGFMSVAVQAKWLMDHSRPQNRRVRHCEAPLQEIRMNRQVCGVP
jgi:hypothetical protein